MINKAKLKKYIAEELEQVASLSKQLTDAQIEKLEAEFDKELIHETLLEMENHNGLAKKYRSVYLTLRNWMNVKRRKDEYKKDIQLKRSGLARKMQYHEALTWLEKRGLPLSSLDQKFKPVKNADGVIEWELK